MRSTLLRALRLVWSSAPGWTTASVALVFLRGLLPIVTLYLLKLLVDAAAESASPSGQGAGRVLFLVALAGGVAVAGVLCRTLLSLVGEAHAVAVTDRVHDLVHAKSVEIGLEHYESVDHYDRLHRAQEEASFRPARILNSGLRLVVNALSLSILGAWLVAFDWAVALVILLATVPSALIRIRRAEEAYRLQRLQTPVERRALYFHWILTGLAHAKEIRAFGLGDLFRRRFRGLRTDLRRARLGIATKRARTELMTQAIGTCVVFGSFAFVAYRMTQGAMSLGDLVMYYQALQRGQEFLAETMGSLTALYEDHLYVSSLYAFLDLPGGMDTSQCPRQMPKPMRDGIVLEGVSFRYPKADRDVLRDVTLTIRPGEHVAIVGENGSGKTTLVKLLCRLYDPTAGRITIDGIDLRQFDASDVRREMSVAFQDYAQYYLTARENIWFGDVAMPADDDGVVAAARLAGAHERLSALPRGYETILGKWIQDGEELSIGEWQKVALARALFRDGQIVVLDEPTSALDPKAEADLFRRIKDLTAGRTTILISHRFSTVRMADRIVVLDGGRVVEAGSHEELISRRGKYAELFETQAQFYRP